MERLNLSAGEWNNLQGRVAQVLEAVPARTHVSLEGTPIFLNQPWDIDHELGYNQILPLVWDILDAKGCSVEHTVLLDEYSVNPRIPAEDYLVRMSTPVHHVVKETLLAPRGRELIAMVGSRGINLDGCPPSSTTRDGRMRGVFLDAAFQESKTGSVNIQVLPYQFKPEQAEMRAILLAVRGRLPFTSINIFFKGRGVNKAYITNAQGSSTCFPTDVRFNS